MFLFILITQLTYCQVDRSAIEQPDTLTTVFLKNKKTGFYPQLKLQNKGINANGYNVAELTKLPMFEKVEQLDSLSFLFQRSYRNEIVKCEYILFSADSINDPNLVRIAFNNSLYEKFKNRKNWFTLKIEQEVPEDFYDKKFVYVGFKMITPTSYRVFKDKKNVALNLYVDSQKGWTPVRNYNLFKWFPAFRLYYTDY